MDYTIAAFGQYVLLWRFWQIREYILPRSRNDFRLQERIRLAEDEFKFNEAAVAGDFTSQLSFPPRIDLVVNKVLDKQDRKSDARGQITNLLFEQPIPRLRETIWSFNDYIDEIVILIDDLDKGWPLLQIETHDISTIRHLLEVLNRIQRDIRKRDFVMKHIVFLRSDVYERLVEHTSDRGKYNVIKVDWSDPEQLRHLIRQFTVINNLDKIHHESVWASVNPEVRPNLTSVDYMIEASLRLSIFNRSYGADTFFLL